MKQLKFMIAATAAIGLAGVAQAAFPTTAQDADSNTGFEGFTAPVDVVTGTKLGSETYSYFWYTGDVAADNESKIIAGQSGLTKAPRAKGAKFNNDANVLEVNTGTAPLLRTINRVVTNEGVSSAEPVTVPAETGIYIDTLVQFTVTPAGDTVTPTADDKLMIYLQEVAPVMDGETVVTAGATNLMVYCGRWTTTVDPEDLMAEPVTDYTGKGANAVTAGSIAIKAGEWYRLVVKSQLLNGKSVFTATLNGTDLTSVNPLIDGKTETTYFPSLKPDDATLKAVGFAGEGLVDDIVFSTTQEAIVDVIDFTLQVSGATAVTAVIGENKVDWADGKFVLPSGTTTFTIEYVPATDATLWNPTYTAALSEAENCTVDGLAVTLGSGAPSAKLTVTATEVGSAPTVGENATADSVGITIGAFSNDTGAALQKVVDWAVKAGLTKVQLNEMAPFEDETGNATNELQEAFLLNCAVSELAAAKAAFKVGALTFDQDGNPVTPAAATSWVDSNDNEIEFNAVPAVLGASELGGTWETATKAHKFFKAVLTK